MSSRELSLFATRSKVWILLFSIFYQITLTLNSCRLSTKKIKVVPFWITFGLRFYTVACSSVSDEVRILKKDRPALIELPLLAALTQQWDRQGQVGRAGKEIENREREVQRERERDGEEHVAGWGARTWYERREKVDRERKKVRERMSKEREDYVLWAWEKIWNNRSTIVRDGERVGGTREKETC